MTVSWACRDEVPTETATATKAEEVIELPRLSAADVDAWSKRAATWRVLGLDTDDSDGFDDKSLQDVLPSKGPAVVAFWATYCPPCLAEMPMFTELAQEGETIVGVSLDGDQLKAAKAVVRERRPQYQQVVLHPPSMKKAGLALEAGLPFTLILGKDGKPLFGFSGKVEKNEVKAALKAAATSG